MVDLLGRHDDGDNLDAVVGHVEGCRVLLYILGLGLRTMMMMMNDNYDDW